MLGMPSIKREGQTMLNMCMEQCEGVYLMKEIERLREALSAIALSYYKDMPDGVDATIMWVGCTEIARSALQKKEIE